MVHFLDQAKRNDWTYSVLWMRGINVTDCSSSYLFSLLYWSHQWRRKQFESGSRDTKNFDVPSTFLWWPSRWENTLQKIGWSVTAKRREFTFKSDYETCNLTVLPIFVTMQISNSIRPSMHIKLFGGKRGVTPYACSQWLTQKITVSNGKCPQSHPPTQSTTKPPQ